MKLIKIIGGFAAVLLLCSYMNTSTKNTVIETTSTDSVAYYKKRYLESDARVHSIEMMANKQMMDSRNAAMIAESKIKELNKQLEDCKAKQ